MKRLLALLLFAALPALADKGVVNLLLDSTATGPGALIVSSGTDVAGSIYSFQLTRLDGTASVSIEATVNGSSWTSIGSMTALGQIVRVPASGATAYRANVVTCKSDPGNATSTYMGSCVVSVVGSLSGSPTLVVLTPTPTAAPTATPTRTPTVTATPTRTP